MAARLHAARRRLKSSGCVSSTRGTTGPGRVVDGDAGCPEEYNRSPVQMMATRHVVYHPEKSQGTLSIPS
jgi:hypothetical protein